jgi:hypothetical protein
MTSSLRNAKKQIHDPTTKTKPVRKKNVVPDSIDLRDRLYAPSVTLVPSDVVAPDVDIPVLDQKDTDGCTGFALASVIYHLQFRSKREKVGTPVSPFMLYSMARHPNSSLPSRPTGFRCLYRPCSVFRFERYVRR